MQNSLFESDKYNTGWQLPYEFPSLVNAKTICIDVETNDKGIQNKKGPGFATGQGDLAGVALGTDDGYRQYFPINHATGANINPAAVIKWLNVELGRVGQTKIGANILYDLGWLRQAGVRVKGPVYCTHIAEFLLNESDYPSLNKISKKYLNEEKHDNLMYEYCADHFGGVADRKSQAENIWRAPPNMVGPYAEKDVDLPLRLMAAQKAALSSEGLDECFATEMQLLPMLLDMKFRGIRVDTDKAQSIRKTLDERIDRDQTAIDKYAGRHVNVDAASDLATLFDSLGIEYPSTGDGNPSFTHTWLKNHSHEITDMIIDLRKWIKFNSTFLNGYIFGYTFNGRIHPEFDPKGARSGRFSSSNPNLQNVPARDEELGPLIRSLFLPDENETLYGLDYSQIEYRYLVHLGCQIAVDKTNDIAIQLAQRYHDDPTTDIHQFVADLLAVDRKPGKNLNFGIVYGLGIGALATSLNRDVDDAKKLKEEYKKHFPFAQELMEKAKKRVQQRGYITTLSGRRRRFDLWEPKSYTLKKSSKPLAYNEAMEKWGEYAIKRAYEHSGLNAVIQGSAADILKMAMVKIYNSGVCSAVGVPLLTVHDELIFSVPDTKEGKEAVSEIKRIMENVVKLRVPLLVDVAHGANWGELK